MAKHNRFKRGQGVFTCRLCGKRTRDVHGSNGNCELCELCEHKSGCENSLSDNGFGDEAWGYFDACQTMTEVDQLFDKAWTELTGETPT